VIFLEAFEQAWSLIKSGFAFSDDDDDDGSEPFAGKTEAEREEFMASMRREWAKPEDEQFLNYHFDSGPYWALDERQKKVADAALNLPPSFLKEEANEMEGHFTRLFAEGHHEIPDHEFDRAEAIINNFGQQIETHEADPNSNQSLEFMQDFNDPNHPWTKAVESYTGYDEANNWQSKNAGEPMEIAFQLLKDRQTILPIDGQEGFLSPAPFEEREGRSNPRFWMGDKNSRINSLQYEKLTGRNDLRSWIPDNYINRKNNPDSRHALRRSIEAIYPVDKYTSERIKQPPLPKPIPSHIEWDGDMGNFSLRGTNDEKLSQMLIGNHYGGYEKMPSSATGISSTTPEAYRRQGHYDKLMRGLINAGIGVGSSERNSDSQPFHEEFQNRMTPNMKIKYGDETDGSHMQPLTYSRKPDFPTYGDSDLAQRDYGARPIQQLPPQPQDNRATIGSVQTRFPVFDNNNKLNEASESMNLFMKPLVPNLKYSFDE
tara:strand:+ start:497 stop:1957 length:1461 start_codon:yes stop_codon:yes gene_type:complete